MSTQVSVQEGDNVARLKKSGDSHDVGISLTQLAIRRLRRDLLTLVALAILGAFAVLSLGAPLITDVLNVSYTKTDVTNAFLPVGTDGHVLGTDDLGRDHLARLLFAGRISLAIAVAGSSLSLVIGLALGIFTGYHGGFIDDIMNWIITTLDSIPFLFLLLVIAAVFSPGPFTLVLVFALLGWTGTTRLIRGETFSLKEREYIVSARAIGASDWRIMYQHIAPNVISILIVNLAISIGTLILIESALSFLGLGVRPPTPTWGNMLTAAQTFFTKGPHLVVAPGLLISITVLCLYIIGDGIRDAFDPQTQD